MGVSNKNYFLLRKLHQFTGAIPLGAYLLVHLLVNSYSTMGYAEFDEKVHLLESMPILIAMEIGLIYLPLIYHSLFGIWVGFIAKNNPLRFPYARNWNFAIQRWTGFFMLFFLAYHAWFMRFQGTPIGEMVKNVGFAGSGYAKVVEHLASNGMMALYAVGLIATTYHFANGLWEFCIDWGITVSMKAQQISAMVMIVVWLGVSALGLMSIAGFRNPALIEEAKQVQPAAAGHSHGEVY
ncbi:succinate dehydrogenase [bacterium]|nr:succinate dehydrogenase [bacterium]